MCCKKGADAKAFNKLGTRLTEYCKISGSILAITAVLPFSRLDFRESATPRTWKLRVQKKTKTIFCTLMMAEFGLVFFDDS